MKQFISVLLVLALIFIVVGCSKNIPAQKDEEDQMQSDTVEVDNNNEGQNQNDSSTTEADNIYDLKAIYEFVKGEYEFKEFKEFADFVDVTMLDVTGNDIDEAILINQLDSKIIVVSVDSDKFEMIPCNLETGKYSTEITTSGDFILLTGTTGGTGQMVEYIDIGYYTGSEIKLANKESITTKYSLSAPDTTCEGKGNIEFVNDKDLYADFNYYYNHYKNDEHVQNLRKNFKFNSNTYTYDVTTIDGGFDKLSDNQTGSDDNKSDDENEGNEGATNDIAKGYTYKIKNDELYLIYNNTKNEVKVAGSSSMKIVAAEKSYDGKRLYYIEEAKFEDSGKKTSYVDVNSLNTNLVGNGLFHRDISKSPYQNYVILAQEIDGGHFEFIVYDDNGQMVCNLGSNVENDVVTQICECIEGQSGKLTGFETETINGETIDYSQYRSVVIPMHDTVNINSLSRHTASFSDNPNNIKVSFSVFGEMKDIKATYYSNMGAQGEVENIGTLNNSYLDIYAPFDFDMSCVKVEGQLYIGEGTYTNVEFTMDTVRSIEEYEVIKY